MISLALPTQLVPRPSRTLRRAGIGNACASVPIPPQALETKSPALIHSHRSGFVQQIKTVTAPAPFLRRAHQAPLHRIAMPISQLLHALRTSACALVASIPTRTAPESCIRSSRLSTLVFQTQYRHGGSGLRAVCEGRELGRTRRATIPHPECSSLFPQLSSKKDQNLVTNDLY